MNGKSPHPREYVSGTILQAGASKLLDVTLFTTIDSGKHVKPLTLGNM
jgi:hypothetical protein